MFKAAEITGILVAPHHVTEGVEVENGLKPARQPIRQIKHRDAVQTGDAEDLDDVLEIPEIRTDRGQDETHPGHGQKLKKHQQGHQTVGPGQGTEFDGDISHEKQGGHGLGQK